MTLTPDLPVSSSGGSVAADSLWDAVGDLAVGSGANTAVKLSMGTALQQIRVNAAGTALEYFTPSGGGWSNMTEAVWAGGTQSEVADGASAVAFDYDTDNAYATSGAKLASWKNNGTEKAYITKDGDLNCSGGIAVGSGKSITGAYQVSGDQNRAMLFQNGRIGVHLTGIFTWSTSGSTANATADTGLARSAAGVVKITDGGTGTGKLIFIVPTSDPGISGALWNNAGTLAISA